MRYLHRLLLSGLMAFALLGCGRKDGHGHSHAGGHGHEHKAPHGGTAIILGQEAYHLELVRDATAGTLSAYILDGHMENFIRVNLPSFEIIATVAGEKKPLTFKPAANPATGETAGNTSQFDVQADWLKSTGTFDAVLTGLEIRGTKFEKVPFRFPQGNDKHQH